MASQFFQSSNSLTTNEDEQANDGPSHAKSVSGTISSVLPVHHAKQRSLIVPLVSVDLNSCNQLGGAGPSSDHHHLYGSTGQLLPPRSPTCGGGVGNALSRAQTLAKNE